jgi:signal transduction histidine kinase
VIESVVQSSPQRERLHIRPASSPLIGNWDFERLERVFDNLATNALKYSAPDTAVIIEIRSEHTDTIPNAVVNVIDSGVGIPEADLPYVFDRFRRGSNVAGSIPGTGIGLAGTRQIVELHGGTVSIESKAGIGTTVTVRLPLQSR